VPRLKTKYHLYRTDTGRLASGMDSADADKKGKKIAQVHNWPKELRDVVVAEPGKVFIGGDWRAVQWALAMWEAGKVVGDGYHWNLLDQQQRGELDPHTFLAERFQPGGGKAARQTAKGYTFGRIFHGNPDVLARECGHPVDTGRMVCKVHDETYRLQPWWDAELEFVLQNKYVETAGGFRRYFWNPVQHNKQGEVVQPKLQEILATKIQGNEADLMKYILGIARFPAWIELITTLHDAMLVQCPVERAEEGQGWLQELMQRPVPFLGGRPWLAEVKVGRNWLEVS
jgi:DNA polymerase I-like protein with 3'-5' exonuclease and polymerase domains